MTRVGFQKSNRTQIAKKIFDLFDLISDSNCEVVFELRLVVFFDHADFDKLKTMDVDLSAGQIIYIPAYWWCSIRFPESAAGLTTVCCFKYRTYMNTVSVLDKLGMWLLQQQNVKRDTIEKKITATNNAVNPNHTHGNNAVTQLKGTRSQATW